jgi:RNA polymerase sigma factor (sigma-70 family)
LTKNFEKINCDSAPKNDLVLIPFLDSKDEINETALTRLFTEHADPVCKKVVEFRTRNIIGIDYFEKQKLQEDLKQDARLKILAQLRLMKINPQIEPIYDFRNYVARITHNLVHDYFRRLRTSESVQIDEIKFPPSEILSETDLLKLNGKETLPSFAADFEETQERIFRLKLVWQELCQLPENQCAAWLLKVADKNNESTLKWLPVFNIATIRQIAAAIGKNAEDLAKIWNNLPFNDQQIADLLNVTQRQVINLRKSANERLQRRIKKILEAKDTAGNL